MTIAKSKSLRPATTSDWKQLRVRHPRKRRRLVIANKKGGSGKTTSTVQLAAALAAWGLRIRVTDGDPQLASSTMWLAPQAPDGYASNTLYEVFCEGRSLDEVTYPSAIENVSIVPSLESLNRVEIERPPGTDLLMASEYDDSGLEFDVELGDAAPSMGIVTVSLLAGADHAMITMRASNLDYVGSSEIRRPLDLVMKRLNPGLQLSTVTLVAADDTTLLLRALRERAVEDYQTTNVFTVPHSIRAAEAPAYNESMISYAPNSPVTTAYWVLAAHLVSAMGLEWETGPSDMKEVAWPGK